MGFSGETNSFFYYNSGNQADNANSEVTLKHKFVVFYFFFFFFFCTLKDHSESVMHNSGIGIEIDSE